MTALSTPLTALRASLEEAFAAEAPARQRRRAERAFDDAALAEDEAATLARSLSDAALRGLLFRALARPDRALPFAIEALSRPGLRDEALAGVVSSEAVGRLSVDVQAEAARLALDGLRPEVSEAARLLRLLERLSPEARRTLHPASPLARELLAGGGPLLAALVHAELRRQPTVGYSDRDEPMLLVAARSYASGSPVLLAAVEAAILRFRSEGDATLADQLTQAVAPLRGASGAVP